MHRGCTDLTVSRLFIKEGADAPNNSSFLMILIINFHPLPEGNISTPAGILRYTDFHQSYFRFDLKRGRNQITAARTITKIDYNSGILEFDGEPLNITEGLFVYTQGWRCGSTDTVLTSSGSPVSNSDEHHCCRYRGIENPWGNLYKWVDGCYCLDRKVYIAENDSPVYLGYSEGYRETDITVPEGKGFPTITGYDPSAEWLRLPIAFGGDREQYSCDFVYDADGFTTMRIGGHRGTPNASGLHGYAPFSPEDYNGTAITGRLIWR